MNYLDHKKLIRSLAPRGKSYFEKAWEFYKHADMLNATRFNFFLVAESMLIVSLATVQKDSFFCFLVIIMGLLFSIVWWIVSWSISSRMNKLKENYLVKESVYNEYINVCNPKISNFLLNHLLPVATIFLWVILLAYKK